LAALVAIIVALGWYLIITVFVGLFDHRLWNKETLVILIVWITCAWMLRQEIGK
jgi:MFS superfamily sulfate permease-like transporter